MITQQEVIKKFMKSPDNTEKSGKDALTKLFSIALVMGKISHCLVLFRMHVRNFWKVIVLKSKRIF